MCFLIWDAFVSSKRTGKKEVSTSSGEVSLSRSRSNIPETASTSLRTAMVTLKATIGSLHAPVGLHCPFKEERCIFLVLVHSKLDMFGRIDSASKRPTSLKFWAYSEVATDVPLILILLDRKEHPGSDT